MLAVFYGTGKLPAAIRPRCLGTKKTTIIFKNKEKLGNFFR